MGMLEKGIGEREQRKQCENDHSDGYESGRMESGEMKCVGYGLQAK
jgi:hypothetical protein